MDGLPAGWTLDRIRALGVRQVTILDPALHYVVVIVGQDLEAVAPDFILDCGGLYLVRPRGDPEWYMGQADGDGSIVCWGSYGPDLENAILAL